MPGPLLLVHDDSDAVQAIGAMLASIDRAFVVARTVDEALDALKAQPVSMVLLAPEVESGRGHVVLEELPRLARGVPVLLLGEAAIGFDHPVAPMPPGDGFRDLVLAPAREALL